MKFYQSNLTTNILVIAFGFLFIISPTALTSTGLSNTYSFYPDLFLCLIFATALNRPKVINLYAVLVLLLFSDVLHMKPIGLFTTLMFTSVLVIRRYKLQIEHSPFYIHYLIFLILLSCVQTLNLFLHHLLFLPKLSLLTIVNQTIFTLICYPLFDIPYKLVKANKS